MSEKSKFILGDGGIRSNEFRKDIDFLTHLDCINKSIEIKGESSHELDHKHIFILGLPRSGTTLLYQYLTAYTNLGYVSNFAARFYKNPYFGLKLQEDIYKNKNLRNNSFESNLGTAKGPFGPHEFGYFWRENLCLSEMEDFFSYNKPLKKGVDWGKIKFLLNSISNFWGAPCIHKTTFLGNYIYDFYNNLKDISVIYIKRDSKDVVNSILDARKRYYDDIDSWWATYPSNYLDISHLKGRNQVEIQVKSLEEDYYNALSILPSSNIIEVKYEDFCSNPYNFFIKINQLFKLDLKFIGDKNMKFEVRRRQ